MKEERKESILKQLKKTPVVEVACKKVGLGRASFYRWKKEDPEFKEKAEEALLAGKFMVNDMAESQLIRAIKEGNMTSIIFWLKNHHPDYRNKIEVSGSLKTRTELTPEQQEQIQKALNHAGLNLQSNLLQNVRNESTGKS